MQFFADTALEPGLPTFSPSYAPDCLNRNYVAVGDVFNSLSRKPKPLDFPDLAEIKFGVVGLLARYVAVQSQQECVLVIFRLREILKVTKLIVNLGAIFVVCRHASGFRSNEGLQHEIMDETGLLISIPPQCSVGVTALGRRRTYKVRSRMDTDGMTTTDLEIRSNSLESSQTGDFIETFPSDDRFPDFGGTICSGHFVPPMNDVSRAANPV